MLPEYPHLTTQFLEALRARYPRKPISPTDTLESIMFEAGKQSLLDHLTAAKAAQDRSQSVQKEQ